MHLLSWPCVHFVIRPTIAEIFCELKIALNKDYDDIRYYTIAPGASLHTPYC